MKALRVTFSVVIAAAFVFYGIASSHASSVVGCQIQGQVTGLSQVPIKAKNGATKTRVTITILTTRKSYSGSYCRRRFAQGRQLSAAVVIPEKHRQKLKKGRFVQLHYRLVMGFSRHKGRVRGYRSVRWSWGGWSKLTAKERKALLSPATPISEVRQVWAPIMKQIKQGKPAIVTLATASAQKGLLIHCPIGLRCDQHYSYRMYIHQAKGLRLTLSFSPKLVGNVSLKNLRKLFSYAAVDGNPFARLTQRGWRIETDRVMVVHRQKTLGKQVVLTGYKGGRLQGYVLFNVRSLAVRNTRPPCAGATKAKKDCRISARSYSGGKGRIQVKLAFALPLQLGVLDCKQTPRPKQCG